MTKLAQFQRGNIIGLLYEEDTPYVHRFKVKVKLWDDFVTLSGENLEELLKDIEDVAFVLNASKDAINERWKKIDLEEALTTA